MCLGRQRRHGEKGKRKGMRVREQEKYTMKRHTKICNFEDTNTLPFFNSLVLVMEGSRFVSFSWYSNLTSFTTPCKSGWLIHDIWLKIMEKGQARRSCPVCSCTKITRISFADFPRYSKVHIRTEGQGRVFNQKDGRRGGIVSRYCARLRLSVLLSRINGISITYS